jgi:hypothetical protein
VEVAYYDTWPGDDGIFAGVNEAPPFYPSGIFTATDRLSGLYVFRVQPTYGIVRGTVRSESKLLSGATVRVLPSGPSFVTGANGIYGLAPARLGIGHARVLQIRLGLSNFDDRPICSTMR